MLILTRASCKKKRRQKLPMPRRNSRGRKWFSQNRIPRQPAKPQNVAKEVVAKEVAPPPTCRTLNPKTCHITAMSPAQTEPSVVPEAGHEAQFISLPKVCGLFDGKNLSAPCGAQYNDSESLAPSNSDARSSAVVSQSVTSLGLLMRKKKQ